MEGSPHRLYWMFLSKTKGKVDDLRVSLGDVGLDKERKLQSWVQSYGGVVVGSFLPLEEGQNH